MNKRQYKRKRNNYIKNGTAKSRRRNKELCHKYPFLVPRQVWSGKAIWDIDHYIKRWSYTELDAIPAGWRKAFGIMLCDELRNELLKYDYLKKYRVEQVKEKWGCYDSQTEVLTDHGWKYFKDLSFQDKIATLNPNTEELEYQLPTDIIAEKYTGKMYRLENRGVSLCVTPNHNLYISKGSYYCGAKDNEKRIYNFELATPEKYFRKDKRFKKGCIWKGEEPYPTFKIKGLERESLFKENDINSGTRYYIDKNREYDIFAFLRFLGFYVAEGHTNLKKQNEISIAYNGLDEENLVCNLLEDIGYNNAYGTKDGAKALKRIYDKTLGMWLIQNCGHLAPNKKVPDFIKQLPPIYIEEFLKYLYIGDGHKGPTSNILSTTSKQLSNDVQELLIKCGYAFRETKRRTAGKTGGKIKDRPIKHNYDEYCINWLQMAEIEVDMSKAKSAKSYREEWTDYKGVVYCVSVPNHIIYIRRNGKGVWCGNSLRWYDNGIPRGCEVWDIIEKYSKLSENICIFCGKPDTWVTDDGWIMPQCYDCFKKQWRQREKYYKHHKLFYKDYVPKTEEELLGMYNGIKCGHTPMMPDKRVYKTYNNGDWKTVEVDISETANKIRKNWGKNK